MKLLFIVLLLALLEAHSYENCSETCDCSQCTTSSHRKEPDFYWKRYYGKVPYDAVDVDNDSIYQPNIFIGLGHVEDEGVFPGTLYRGTSLLKVVGIYGIQTLCDNVMILCSKNKKNFRWMQVKYTDVPSLKNNFAFKLVPAGFDKNSSENFIGRIHQKGIPYVGRVVPDSCYDVVGLWIIKNDKFDLKREFEILTYFS